MRLFFILVLFFFVELAILIKVGGWIGVFPVIALIILSALVGCKILGRKGLGSLRNAREQADYNINENPVEKGLDSMATTFCGLLLIIPGFLTDIIALCGLVPVIRKWMIGQFLKGFSIKVAKQYASQGEKEGSTRSNHKGKTIEGQYVRHYTTDKKSTKKID